MYGVVAGLSEVLLLRSHRALPGWVRGGQRTPECQPRLPTIKTAVNWPGKSSRQSDFGCPDAALQTETFLPRLYIE